MPVASSAVADDPQDRSLNLLAAAAFFLLCLAVHHGVSGACFRRRLRTYSELSWQLRMEWDSRIVSSLHAMLVTGLSFYVLVCERQFWDDKLRQTSRISGLTLSMSTGYMLADAISMPFYWRDLSLLVFWIHHGIAAFCFFICAHKGILHFFALFRLLSELSTPFLNVNWCNRLCRVRKDSALNLANSLCLTVTYILCRVVPIPAYWYYFVASASSTEFVDFLRETGVISVVWLVSSVILDLLNLYWAKGILTGGLKTVRLGLRMRGSTAGEKKVR